jgi:hypothetical protein
MFIKNIINLKKMLRNNPAERITAKDALLHPYFKDVAENMKYLYDTKK